MNELKNSIFKKLFWNYNNIESSFNKIRFSHITSYYETFILGNNYIGTFYWNVNRHSCSNCKNWSMKSNIKINMIPGYKQSYSFGLINENLSINNNNNDLFNQGINKEIKYKLYWNKEQILYENLPIDLIDIIETRNKKELITKYIK